MRQARNGTTTVSLYFKVSEIGAHCTERVSNRLLLITMRNCEDYEQRFTDNWTSHNFETNDTWTHAIMFTRYSSSSFVKNDAYSLCFLET